MNSRNGVDTQRVALALELLRTLLSGASPGLADSHTGQLPLVPPLPLSTKKLSATDLLGGWFRPAPSITDPWDEYFGQPARLGVGATAMPASTVSTGTPSVVTPQLATQTFLEMFQSLGGTGMGDRTDPASDSMPWIEMWELFDESSDELFDEHAEAAVTCLYDFTHAIGERNVDAAMGCVANEYHVFEDDREIGRLALRHQLESMLDSLRGWELYTALAEVPTPIFHPNGDILIYTDIQIYAYQPDEKLSRLISHRRIGVFVQENNQAWKIAALSRIPA